VSTAEALPRRIFGFVQWLLRTPWPVFALSVLQADIIGALLVLGFLRYGLPPEDRIELQDLPRANLALFALTLVLLFATGFSISTRLLVPVFRWQRRDGLLGDTDPATTELARSRALRMPFYRVLISMGYWSVGGTIFIIASWRETSHLAPVVAVAVALGATATAIIGYLQNERVLRPVAVAALRGGLPENIRASGVIGRQMLAWALSTGVPLLAIVLAVVAD
jgi:adenylate cyclase